MKTMMASSCLVLALLAAACDSAREGGEPTPPKNAPTGDPKAVSAAAKIATPAEAEAAAGKAVEVTGDAVDAKISAAVKSGDLLVYCLDRESWPADQAGKKVTVRGTLEHTDEFAAKEDPPAAGTAGKVFAIRKAELVKE